MPDKYKLYEARYFINNADNVYLVYFINSGGMTYPFKMSQFNNKIIPESMMNVHYNSEEDLSAWYFPIKTFSSKKSICDYIKQLKLLDSLRQ